MSWYVSITSCFMIIGTGCLLCWLQEVSCLYFFFYLGAVDNRRRRGGGWVDGMTPVWPSSLINDWFVLVRLFHSSCKLDSMQILGWMLLSLKHNDDAQWCMFARCIGIEPERKKGKESRGCGWKTEILYFPFDENGEREKKPTHIGFYTTAMKERCGNISRLW